MLDIDSQDKDKVAEIGEKKICTIIGSDGLIGSLSSVSFNRNLQNVTMIEVIGGSAKEVIDRTCRHIKSLKVNEVPAVVISAGSRDVSVEHYGSKHIRESNISGSDAGFVREVVEVTEGLFLQLKQLVIEKGGKVLFAFICPCPAEQSSLVSRNPLIIQLTLSKVFEAMNNMINKLNKPTPTPNVKQDLEARGNRRVLMFDRRQKRIKMKSFVDGVHPTAGCQNRMMKTCLRSLARLRTECNSTSSSN